MMTLTLCLATLAQPPVENESDRIREEIKAKWGVLMKDPQVRKELRITQTVYHSGKMDAATRGFLEAQKMTEERLGRKDTKKTVPPESKPSRLSNSIEVKMENDRAIINVKGQVRDSLTGIIRELHNTQSVALNESTEYQKFEKQSNVMYKDSERPVMVFSNYLEPMVSSYLFGFDHKAARSNPIPLKKLEFTKNENQIIGMHHKDKTRSERYIFSPQFNNGIISSETNTLGMKIIGKVEYKKINEQLLPSKWSVTFIENGEVIQHREMVLDQFLIGNLAGELTAIPIPVDTVIVDRRGETESLSRVLSNGSIVPIDRSDRSKPLDKVEAHQNARYRIKLLAMTLIGMGIIGFIVLLFKKYKRKT